MSEEIDLDVLAESFAEFLGGEWPREKAIAWAREPGAYGEGLWNEVTALGWPALTVPETQGGLGLGTAAAAALHHALGAAAAPLPMLGTTVATALVASAGTAAQQEELLGGLATGAIRAAVGEPGSGELVADGAAVSGVVLDLLDAPAATHLFVPASRAGQRVWLVIAADAPGVAIAPTALADATHTLGTVTLTDVALDDAAVIAATDAAALDDELRRVAGIALAADAQGGGEAVLAATIEYMKGREQFGRVIASFQALKHRVADHQCGLVAARALLDHAASLPADHPEALLYALSAKQHTTRLAAEIARDCIQLHGGVGFTAEYVPHIYLKRAKLNEALYGTRAVLLDRIADLLEAA